MNNPYQKPASDLGESSTQENNSGMKEKTYPDGVKGWSWGAFLLNWIWALGNKSYIGLLAIIPYVGFIVSFIWVSRAERWLGEINAGKVLNILIGCSGAGRNGA